MKYSDCTLHKISTDKNGKCFKVTLNSLEDPRKFLMFMVGDIEGTLLSACIYADKLRLHRPDTIDTLYTILEKTGNEITNIYITRKEGLTVYSEMEIYNPLENQKMTIDCRPSDSISIAIKKNIPIQVHDSLLDIEEEAARKIYDKKSFDKFGNNLDGVYLESLGVDLLQKKIQTAVEEENYELAKKIKDVIDNKKGSQKL